MKKGILSLILALAMICVLFAACDTTPVESSPAASESTSVESEAPESNEPEVSEETTYNVVDIVQSMQNESQAFSLKMLQKHAAEYGVNLTYLDSKADPATEAQNVSTAIAQGADAIIINPNDIKGIVPSLMEAKEAGIVVCLFSSDLGEESQQYRDFYCGANDLEAGKTAAQAFIDQFPDGANIVEIGGQAGHDAQIKRTDGFDEGLEGHPEIVILDNQNCKAWAANDAMNIMQDFIVRFGDQLDGVFCHWDNGYTGVIQAMTNANMDPSSIFSVAIDGCKAGFDQVEAGTQTVCLMQDFEQMAIRELELCCQVLDGTPVAEADKINYIPWGIVTKDTIGDFTYPEW